MAVGCNDMIATAHDVGVLLDTKRFALRLVLKNPFLKIFSASLNGLHSPLLSQSTIIITV